MAVKVSLDAVVVAVTDDRPRILTVGPPDLPALPSGQLDVGTDPSLDLAMRRVIDDQAGLEVEYLEQLYTFGDIDRRRVRSSDRSIAVGYLVLTREAPTSGRWMDWYHLLPWEDHRSDSGDREALRAAVRWAGRSADRGQRVQIAFGTGGTPWDGVRALDRYELLYEAELVPEWYADHGDDTGNCIAGEQLGADHRRIAATALSRLRGKLTYRPIVCPRTWAHRWRRQT